MPTGMASATAASAERPPAMAKPAPRTPAMVMLMGIEMPMPIIPIVASSSVPPMVTPWARSPRARPVSVHMMMGRVDLLMPSTYSHQPMTAMRPRSISWKMVILVPFHNPGHARKHENCPGCRSRRRARGEMLVTVRALRLIHETGEVGLCVARHLLRIHLIAIARKCSDGRQVVRCEADRR